MLVIYQTIGGLFAFLALATLIGLFLQSSRHLEDLGQRLFSWWIILPLFVFTLVSKGPWFLILLGFTSFLGLREYFSAIPSRPSDRLAKWCIYLAIPVQYALIRYHANIALDAFPICLFILLAVVTVLTSRAHGFLLSFAKLYWGAIAIIFLFSHIGIINYSEGLGTVLFLVMLAQLNDVAQYCFGKFFDGIKIAPHISPNKTLSGFIGGMLTITLLAVPLARLLTYLNTYEALLAGLIIAISGFVGDLMFSAIKRDMGIKDFSGILPGHGGILDRIDSLIISAPVFYYFLVS